MAGQPGRLGRVAISTSSITGPWTTIGCLTEGTFSGDMSVVDTTCHDNGQDTTAVPGKRTRTMDVEARYDESDAGQDIVFDVFNGTGECFLRWRMKEAATNRELTAAAVITSYEEGMPNDDAEPMTASFQISGAVTEATQ
jgi:hypothetical protein